MRKVDLKKYSSKKYRLLVAAQLDKAITGRYHLPMIVKSSDLGFADVATMCALGLGISALMMLSGCGAAAHYGEHAEISGSPKALAVLFDGLNGVIKTGKESPEANNEYMALRARIENEETKRATAPGFFAELFQGNGGAK